MNLQEMKVKELRILAGEKNIAGRWEMKKDQLILAIERVLLIEEATNLGLTIEPSASIEDIKNLISESQNSKEESTPNRKGRTRIINVYKDGQLVETIEGLLNTFKWAADNNISNQGWVKHSLKNNVPTVPGRKFKEGGYLFQYAE
ncbi:MULTISPECIES: Rho termination factor N-terminal domain-containing protein [Bacillus]|uniref:Rho termination factor N-terminal domain-containing protein n=1 Tax=Bacillus TaxID=1386 RepID=UPI0015D52236|nr:Rho termination factor N-terminal domain-containing protein [Bacillus wiedmannii]